jgi:hypothetical protein
MVCRGRFRHCVSRYQPSCKNHYFLSFCSGIDGYGIKQEFKIDIEENYLSNDEFVDVLQVKTEIIDDIGDDFVV